MHTWIVRYVRLNCGCTLDLTLSEWDTVCRLPADATAMMCPKCLTDPAHIIASWRPSEKAVSA
jgi:hypothetical protein